MKLSDIRVSNHIVTVDGIRYVVTTGTGEYHTNLGTACFVYDADEVEALDAAKVCSYQGFCDATTPETDRRVAVVLAARDDLRVIEGGSCRPVLSDADYALIREAVGAL